MPNLMQGRRRKVLKSVGAFDICRELRQSARQRVPARLPAVVKAASYEQLTHNPRRIWTLAPRVRVPITNASLQQT